MVSTNGLRSLLQEVSDESETAYRELLFFLLDGGETPKDEIVATCRDAGRTIDELNRHVEQIQQRRHAADELNHTQSLHIEAREADAHNSRIEKEVLRVAREHEARLQAEVAKLRAERKPRMSATEINRIGAMAQSTLNATASKRVAIEIDTLQSRISQIKQQPIGSKEDAATVDCDFAGEIEVQQRHVIWLTENKVGGDFQADREKLNALKLKYQRQQDYIAQLRHRQEVEIGPLVARIAELQTLLADPNCIDFDDPPEQPEARPVNVEKLNAAAVYGGNAVNKSDATGTPPPGWKSASV